jgi:predicted acylesterase/phospholipase RssA
MSATMSGVKAGRKARFARLRPLDQMEVAIVRAATERPGGLDTAELAALRYALNLARVEVVPTPEGDVPLDGFLDEYHARVVEALEPLTIGTSGVVERHELRAVVPSLRDLTHRVRAALLARFGARFDLPTLDREVCHKALVVVAGGGGGSGYVYGGALKLLDDLHLEPRLIVGTSMGSIMGLFRARRRRFELEHLLEVGTGLRWRDVFELPQTRSHYGLPASLRLYLRRGISRHFWNEDAGRVLRMSELEIPLRVVVAGLGQGDLQHDLGYYEHLMDDVVQRARLSPFAMRDRLRRMTDVIGELVRGRGAARPIVLGGDPLTADFDVVDAVGFSSAVPGLIHYDVLRDDPHMHGLLQTLLREQGVSRLIDGGVVANVPSRIAWEQVQRGDIGTRNAFILAMDCFTPQLVRNLVAHPIQRLVRPQVQAHSVYAGFTKNFLQVLSPLELVPPPEKIAQAVRNGYQELAHERRFLREMMRPIPGLDLER